METSTVRISMTALAALAAAILLTAPAEAASRHNRCEPEVQGELARLQVDPARVGDISYQVRRYSNRNDNSRVQGILGWVDLTDCAGRLVVDMSPRCRVKQTYTRGACTIPGVPAY